MLQHPPRVPAGPEEHREREQEVERGASHEGQIILGPDEREPSGPSPARAARLRVGSAAAAHVPHAVARVVRIQRSGDAKTVVREAALATTTIQRAIVLLDRSPGLVSKELGRLIGAELGMNWAAASHLRYGSALKQWVEWISPSVSLFDGGGELKGGRLSNSCSQKPGQA